MKEKIERQLPTGIGGEKLKENRETLPAVEVANEVSWVNNKMNLPFDLRVGEPTKLGMFLTPNPQEDQSTFNLEVSGSHTRSGILGRVIFSDKDGRLYRDIDLKGTGFIQRDLSFNWENVEIKVAPVEGHYGETSGKRSEFSYFGGSTGIANQELIRRDVNYSEKFLKAGIRTHRVIAVVDLKEIIDASGNKISVTEAKNKGILSKEDEPVIEIRAFGVRWRIHDVVEALSSYNPENNKAARRILLDAKNMVAQELGRDPDGFSYKDYFEWLVLTTALNLARMRHNKWVSGYLTEHNIILDGRFVDLDSVETESEVKRKTEIAKRESDRRFVPKDFSDDYQRVEDSLHKLFGLVTERMGPSYSYYNSIFLSTSLKEFYEREFKRLQAEKVIKVRN